MIGSIFWLCFFLVKVVDAENGFHHHFNFALFFSVTARNISNNVKRISIEGIRPKKKRKRAI